MWSFTFAVTSWILQSNTQSECCLTRKKRCHLKMLSMSVHKKCSQWAPHPSLQRESIDHDLAHKATNKMSYDFDSNGVGGQLSRWERRWMELLKINNKMADQSSGVCKKTWIKPCNLLYGTQKFIIFSRRTVIDGWICIFKRVHFEYSRSRWYIWIWFTEALKMTAPNFTTIKFCFIPLFLNWYCDPCTIFLMFF